MNPDDYSIEDLDEQLRWRRALQIAEGIEAPPGFVPRKQTPIDPTNFGGNPVWQTVLADPASLQNLMNQFSRLSIHPEELPRVHSQVRFRI